MQNDLRRCAREIAEIAGIDGLKGRMRNELHRRGGKGGGGLQKAKGAQNNDGNNERCGWQRGCTYRRVGRLRLAPAVEGQLDLGHGEMLPDQRKENRRLLGFAASPDGRRESDARQCRYDSSDGQGHTATASLPVSASREGGRQNGTISSRHSAFPCARFRRATLVKEKEEIYFSEDVHFS